MHRLNELATKLTPAQVKEVEDFAEFLISRAPDEAESARSNGGPGVNVAALTGLCRGMGGDKSDKELIREAWDEIAAKYD
jgi:hypothetical protein